MAGFLLAQAGLQIPAWLEVAATVVSAVSTLSGAASQAAAYQYQADVEKQNAVTARQQGAEAERQHRINSAKLIGQARANAGATGLAFESFGDSLAESAYNAEIDALNIRYGAEVTARGHEASARLYKSRSKNAFTSGLFKAGTSLLFSDIGNSAAKTVPTTSGVDILGPSLYDDELYNAGIEL